MTYEISCKTFVLLFYFNNFMYKILREINWYNTHIGGKHVVIFKEKYMNLQRVAIYPTIFQRYQRDR